MPCRLLKYALLFALLLTWAAPLAAQSPGAGIGDREIQRQEEMERQRRQELEDRAPDIHFQTQTLPEAQLSYPANEAPCLVINEIILEGRDSDKFQWALKAVAEARGRCLGAMGLNVLMSRVQNQILEEGYITTRIVAAPQDLGNTLWKKPLLQLNW
jgi:hemolysin activation/secretion protein